MRYMTKRRRIRSVAWAMACRLTWGEPQLIAGTECTAKHDGWCQRCGEEIESGHMIARFTWVTEAHGLAQELWMHFTCGGAPFYSITKNLEEHDDIVPIKPHPDCRGKCAVCKTAFNGRPGWLVTDASMKKLYACEECVNKS